MRSAKNDLQNTIQSQGILENKYLSRHLDAAIPLRSADTDLKKTIELQHTTVQHIAVMHRFQSTKYLNTCKLPKHCNTLQYLQYNTSLLCTTAVPMRKVSQHMQSTISTASNKKRKKLPVRAHFEQDSTAKRRRLNPSRARAYTFLRNGIFVYRKISFGGIPNSRNVLFLQIFLKRAGKPSAGNTSARFPCAK